MQQIVPRAQLAPGRWDAFVAAHEAGWFFHSEDWIRYALAYAPGSQDGSIAVTDGDEIFAIIPRLIDASSFGGQMLPAPLAIETVTMAPRDVSMGMRMTFRPGQEIERESIPPRGVVSHVSTYVVDLWDGDEVAHWRRLRKSYRSLIHQAEQRYDVTVASGPTGPARPLVFNIAQTLHLAAAGRRTRDLRTWRYMADWAADGRGVIAVAHEKTTREYLGFAYAVRWKNWSYWMSGATLRPNLQHALQWYLIRTLMHDGETHYYEVGHAAPSDSDVKTKSIAWFKSGFGGTVWTVPIVETVSD